MVRLTQQEFESAAAKGFLRFHVSKLAREACVSESTVRLWALGAKVGADSARAIAAALTAEDEKR